MSAALPQVMARFEQSPVQSPEFSEESSALAAEGTTTVRWRRQSSSSAASAESERKGLEDHVEGALLRPVSRAVSEAEVFQHKSHADAWVVVDGIVYDISKFLAVHPGGSQVLVENLQSKGIGKVMRGEDEAYSHSHSRYAFRMLQQFRIGHVSDDDNSSTEHGSENRLRASSASLNSRYTVDLNKPLVFQVGKLGADYEQWVHDPIVQKEPPRFFKSDVAEFFTKTAWWVIPAVWGPLVIYIALGAIKEGLWMSALPLGMALGGFIWTFVEYLLHRFVFHMKTSGYWSNTAHYFLHGSHHKHPMDGTRLVFPPAMTAIIVAMTWYVTEPIGYYIMGRPLKWSAFGGGLLAYIVYDLTHYFLHFGTPFNDMSRTLKRFHLNHHFKKPTHSYGVTTPFWDTVFDTFPEQANKIFSSSGQGMKSSKAMEFASN